MSVCKVCNEKQIEIDRILSAYKKDKIKFAKERKLYIKWLLISNAISIGIFILFVTLGKSSIQQLFNIIIDKFD